jgi:predicted dehydrogenase
METIQYGIIGSGKHALLAHALPAQELVGLELAAICDTSEASLEEFARSYGGDLQLFSDREHFLQSQIGAVLVTTPDEAHFNDMTASLDAGKHTFVEKPVAVTVADTEELRGKLEDAEQAGLIVSSCHPRRFDPPFVWLKEALPGLQSELGDPVEFQFDFSYPKPSRRWKEQRGLLLDHANHEIDLTNFYFGRSGFEAHRLADSYDQYRVAGIRDDGIAFRFSGTRRLNAPSYQERVRIRFEMGEVALAAHSGEVSLTNHNTGATEQTSIPPTDYGKRGLATMANFRDAALGVDCSYLESEDMYVNTATSVMLTEQSTWRYDYENR